MSLVHAASPSVAEHVLRYALAVGATLVLLIPEARASHALLGWLPLWLLAMPLAGWLAVRVLGARGAVEAAGVRGAAPATARMPALPATRRKGPQARRRPRRNDLGGLGRAA